MTVTDIIRLISNNGITYIISEEPSISNHVWASEKDDRVLISSTPATTIMKSNT
jgi:hypothetical protein